MFGDFMNKNFFKVFGLSLAILSLVGMTSCKSNNNDPEPEIPTATYEVEFNTNGGTSVATRAVSSGSTITTLPTSYKTGYIFAGWYKDKELTVPFTTETVVTGHITLYAKWEEEKTPEPVIEYATITFETNGGNAIDAVTVEKGSTYTAPTPAREGYNFLGWYTNTSLTTPYSGTVSNTITLYAKWEKKAEELTDYINAVNYNNDGQTVKIAFTSSDSIVFPVIEGATLEGLYTSSSYSTRIAADAITNKSTVYFKWNSNNEYSELATKVDITSYINTLINNTKNSSTPYRPAWNQEGFKDKWNYIDGVFLKSIIDLYKETNESSYKEFVHDFVNYYINSSGQFIKPSSGSTSGAFATTELDSICESQILFDLNEWYGSSDTRYATAIETTYSALNSMGLCSNGINWQHKSSYSSQIWLDGMYMYGSFLARYANYKNDSSLLDKLKNQYEYIYENMRNADGLYVHAMDTSKSIFWCDENTGLSKNVWLRSTGWLIVSLADVLEYYPDGDNKTFLKKMLSEAVDSIAETIDEYSMMYYQLPALGASVHYVASSYLSGLKNTSYQVSSSYKDQYIANYLETSGSSMVAYTMMKSAKAGYIDSKYYDMGYKTFEGVYEQSFDSSNNTLSNICITAGLGPSSKAYRDGSEAYYLAEPVGSNDAKGVGPFIMAFLEYNKYND